MAGRRDEGFEWQVGVWDRMAAVYEREIDRRFGPVIEGVLRRAALGRGEAVLDLGTGTGAVAIAAAARLGPDGRILAVDVSPEMLAHARARIDAVGLPNVRLAVGRAEAIPAGNGTIDAVLASLSLMYAIDRAAAAGEIARVLRPGGRMVAAVWGGPEACDIVRFQQIAGSFAPAPPVAGVGPGAMADPSPFLDRLAAAGLDVLVEAEVTGFEFAGFDEAWETLAGVTAAMLEPGVVEQARAAVQAAMWPDPASPRSFANRTQYIVATKLA